jgi:hypothetical protein
MTTLEKDIRKPVRELIEKLTTAIELHTPIAEERTGKLMALDNIIGDINKLVTRIESN